MSVWMLNPRVLFLDAVTSKFILPALFAVMPFDMQDDNISTKALHYASLREKTSETVKYPSDPGSVFPFALMIQGWKRLQTGRR